MVTKVWLRQGAQHTSTAHANAGARDTPNGCVNAAQAKIWVMLLPPPSDDAVARVVAPWHCRLRITHGRFRK
jgi:hypothetical protein